MKIGAHTGNVLLINPLETRLFRFYTGYESASMAALYFDETILFILVSYWFFRASTSPTGITFIASLQAQFLQNQLFQDYVAKFEQYNWHDVVMRVPHLSTWCFVL